MLNGEIKDRIVELKEAGYSNYEIAKELGIKQDSVRNYWYRFKKNQATDDDVVGTLLKQNESLRRKLHKIVIQNEIDKAFAERINVPIIHKDVKPSFSPAREEAVLILSDIHYGMLHKGATNYYTPEIAEERLRSIVANAEEILYKFYPHITKMNIFLLGDMVEGYGIFKGQEYSAIPLTDQIEKFPAILSDIIAHIKHDTEIFAVRGNHGRIERGASQHNWDTVVYNITKQMLPDVPFTVADDFFLPVKILNTEFILVHGDGITSARDPESIIERTVGRFTMMFKKQDIYFDYMAMAHFHSVRRLPSAFVNGSVCGDSLLATQRLQASEKPKQLLLFIDEKYGYTNFREIQP
jgi:predicted transcriptional regulator